MIGSSGIRLAIAALSLGCAGSVAFAQGADTFNPNADRGVYTMAVLKNGNVVLGGAFQNLGGQARNCLGRVSTNGSFDSLFSPGVIGSAVNCLAVQNDGRILVGGQFRSLAGATRDNIGRFNANGTLDTFNPAASNAVHCLALQPDGMVLVGGSITNLGGQPRNFLGRLDALGILDTNFNPGANGPVNSIAVQEGGGMVVAGAFTSLAGGSRSYIGRLSTSGLLDTNFNPVMDTNVLCVALQADGKILVGGEFTSVNATSRQFLARLNPDGSLDPGFDPGAGASVHSFALQADGGIIVAGAFTNLAGAACDHLGRLNSDGTFDASFNPGASSNALALMIQQDGRVLAGGTFTNLGAKARNNIGRITNGPPTEILSANGTNLSWVFGGTAPLTYWAHFDICTNNVWVTNLPSPARVAGGWELPVAGLPANPSIRAYGTVIGGRFNGSCWTLQTYAGSPAILLQPAGITNNAGTNFILRTVGEGQAPVTYTWYRNGSVVTNDGNVIGATTPNLTLKSLSGASAGGYSVVISSFTGTATSSVATVVVRDPIVLIQPTNRYVNVGEATTLSVTTTGAPPVYQWRKEGVAIAGATNSVVNFASTLASDAGVFDVVVSNAYGSLTSNPAILSVNTVTIDSLNPTSSLSVYALLLQPDGKILVGGNFTTLAGKSAHRIGRLNGDGTWDNSFIPPGVDYSIFSVLVREGGRFLTAGWFDSVYPAGRTNLALFGPDGTLEKNFAAGANAGVNFPGIYSLVREADGRTLVGGSFRYLAGRSCTNIGRLNADGTLDTAFRASANDVVYPITLQPDGKILVAGDFTSLCGQPRSRIGRLNADGTLDTSFNPGADDIPLAMCVQTNGQILVVGGFTSLGGASRKGIGRLNANGSLDQAFNPGADGGVVRSVVLQANGKLLVAGEFSSLCNVSRSRIGRLNSDGSLDLNFNPGADNTIYGLTIQPDGKILVGGNFTNLRGTARSGIARLNNTDAAVNDFFSDSTSLTWLRSGGSPEPSSVRLELSTNGLDWISAGVPVRDANGWALSGINIPANATIRARSYFVSARYNAAGWFEEISSGPPAINAHPLNQTNDAATVATFRVTAVGSATLGYQWLRDGTNLVNSAKISGAQTGTLTLGNLLGGDMGGYSVVVTNAYGAVTSLVANLQVVEPIITNQPVDKAVVAGQAVSFFVNVAGSRPLAYQWRRNGLDVPGATGSTLAFIPAWVTNAGVYEVVVSNQFGTVTSTRASLTVNGITLASFNPTPAPANQIKTFAIMPDERILIAGDFLGRLNKDGTSDAGFNPVPGGPGSVSCLAVQADGRILVGGYFTSLGGLARTNFGRLNADGSVDAGFDCSTTDAVNALAIQPDGKILVAGAFQTLGGVARNCLARVRSDGGLDAGFNPGFSGNIRCIASQADGRILVGGDFISVGGQSRLRLARLNADGTLDAGFNPGAGGSVYTLNVLTNGNILVTGPFTSLAGQAKTNVGLLDATGKLVAAFNASVGGTINSICEQADGGIIAGGNFSSLNGQARTNLGRLSSDGSLDLTFNPSASQYVNTVALESDGAILIGGAFANVSGASRNYAARLVNTSAGAESLSLENYGVLWSRSGSLPNLEFVAFDVSTNGVDWKGLGQGARAGANWTLIGNSPIPGETLRARGGVRGGFGNGSSWFVESSVAVTSLPPSMLLLREVGAHSGQFGFEILSGFGNTVVVEAGTDLFNWAPVTTNSVGAGPVYFQDSTSGGPGRRFYRVRMQ